MSPHPLADIGRPGRGDASSPAPAVRIVRARPVRSLLMWSGGPGSTHALLRLLRETEDEVIVHHLHLHAGPPAAGSGHRCAHQAKAVSRLLPPLQSRERAFVYEESRVDLSALGPRASDHAALAWMAAQSALAHALTPFDRIVFGHGAHARRWQPDTYANAHSRLVTQRIIRGVWECDDVPHLYLFSPRPTRREQLSYLGGELAEHTVCCERPVARERGFAGMELEACDVCAGCVERGRALAALASDAGAGMEAQRRSST